MGVIREVDGSVEFTVRVSPRSGRSEIIGEMDGAIKVKIAAPPVDGAANVELIKLLAATFDVSRNKVVITSGLASRRKTVRISGIGLCEAEAVLGL